MRLPAGAQYAAPLPGVADALQVEINPQAGIAQVVTIKLPVRREALEMFQHESNLPVTAVECQP